MRYAWYVCLRPTEPALARSSFIPAPEKPAKTLSTDKYGGYHGGIRCVGHLLYLKCAFSFKNVLFEVDTKLFASCC